MPHQDKPPFRADHVGSLLRPKKLTEAFRKFSKGQITIEDFKTAQNVAIKDVIELQENVGLKSITDGEFRRASYWSTFVERVKGMEISEALFKFNDDHGNKQDFTAPLVTGKVSRTTSIAGDEFLFLKNHTTKTPKITIVSPPTMHMFRLSKTIEPGVYKSTKEYFADLTKVYQQEIHSLAKTGATYIQIDDVPLPMLSDPLIQQRVTDDGLSPKQLMNDYIELFNGCLENRPDRVTIAVHMCRGNYKGKFLSKGGYEPFAEQIFNQLDVDAYFLEYDSPRTGDFEPLKYMPKNKTVVLGIVSSKNPKLETHDEITKKIDDAANHIEIEQLALSPQCGFASTVAGNPITADEQKAKLSMIVEVADRIWG